MDKEAVLISSLRYRRHGDNAEQYSGCRAQNEP